MMMPCVCTGKTSIILLHLLITTERTVASSSDDISTSWQHSISGIVLLHICAVGGGGYVSE